MVDWLIVWGAAEAVGILVKPILEDLAKDSAKDYAKDFFKDCLKKVIRLPEKDVQKEAYGKALKEFLELVEQELENAGFQKVQIKQYIQPVQQFVNKEQVAAILGQAFESECRILDTKVLAQSWQTLNLPNLPPDFDWDLVCKLYIRKVKAIVQKSDALRPIFAAESQAAAAESLQELAGIAPEFDLGRYAEGLREQYGNLKLESLDTTGVYYNELKLWKIFVPQNVRECQEFLPQVYEIPKEHLRRLRERGELDEAAIAQVEMERYRQMYVEQPICPILEVVGDPKVPVGAFRETPLPPTVILGDPGSGKSTLLQYLALVWAERPVSQLPLYPIPLLVELRTYARDKQEKKCHDILSFIHSGNITCRLNQQQLHEKLKAGDAIALFDGIDEVFDPQLREGVVTDIHRFTNDYPHVRAIATSRWLGYKAQRLRDAGFRHFMLQDLEPEQIEDFIQRWHDLTFQEGLDKTRKRERLQKAIQDSKAIRELAGNPLLLTMMAILNRNQELPRDRSELYNQASRVLLHQWDVERNLIEQRLDPLTIDYRDKQAMLRKVAYHMQSSEKGLTGNIISAADLEKILTDYLKVLEVEQPRTVARLMINQLRTRNFILCYLGADSYAFVHRTFLEYFCAWEFVWQFKETQTLTIDQLTNEVFANHWQDETWHEVLYLICGMVETNISESILKYLLEQDDQPTEITSLIVISNCLSNVRNQSSIKHIIVSVVERLKNAIHEIDASEQRDKTGYNKLLKPLSEISQKDLSFLNFLKEHIQSRRTSFCPDLAIKLIIENFKNEPTVLEWIKSCLNSEHMSTRTSAIQGLLLGWHEDPEAIVHLKSYLENTNNDWWEKYVSIQLFPQFFKESPDTLIILKKYATFEEERYGWRLRSAAIKELKKYQKVDSDIFALFVDRALNDSFERQDNELGDNPRQVALEAIVEDYSDNPQTLTILYDRATNDPDEKVREFARQQLVKLEQSQTSGT
jgi:Trp operon repressor/energy-coupling factor transporter ATP-binding protein EcfA2